MTVFHMKNQRKTQSIVFVLLLAAYVSIIFSASFLNDSELLQTDQPMWASAAQLMREDIFPTQKWFWGVISDRIGAGQQLGNSYSMSLILPWALSFFMSIAASIKVSMLVSVLLFVIGFYFVAELYMPKGWAFLCSLVLLTPMFDNIVSGMWYNYFSLGCGFVFWRSCHAIFEKCDLRYGIVAIISLSLAIYSHQVGTFLCLLIWFSYMLLILVKHRNNRMAMMSTFIIIAILGALLSYPQIHAILAPKLSSLQNARPFDFPVTDPLETLRRMIFIRVWGAASLTQPKIALMGIQILTVLGLFSIGLYSLIKLKDHEKIIPAVGLILIAFILISRVYNLLGMDIGLLRSLSNFYDRFQLLSQIYLVLISGVGLSYLSGYLHDDSRYGKFIRVLFIVCLISFTTVAVRTPKKIFYDRTEQLGTLGTSTINQEVHALWAWINKNVQPQKERIYIEDTYKSLKWNSSDNPESSKSHLLALTSLYTGVSQINGWCGYTHYFSREHEYGQGGSLFGHDLAKADLSDEYIQEEMKLLNCRYLIVHTEAAKTRLAQVPFLRRIEKIGEFDIFEGKEFKPAWAYKYHTGEEVFLKKNTPVSYDLSVTGKLNELIQVSLANNANWKAYYKGRVIPIHDNRALLQVSLPAEGFQLIELRYYTDKKSSLIILCLGVILLAVYILFSYIGPFRMMGTLKDQHK
jgi:hypothetical protein